MPTFEALLYFESLHLNAICLNILRYVPLNFPMSRSFNEISWGQVNQLSYLSSHINCLPHITILANFIKLLVYFRRYTPDDVPAGRERKEE